MANNYVDFLRDITLNNLDSPLRPSDFLSDILNLLHRMWLKDPTKLENFIGNALFGKYFEHLNPKEEKKI